MPAKRTRTSATPATEISIATATEQLKTTEQALRLALIDIRPDDFDTVKVLSQLDFEAVAKKIAIALPATIEPQLLAHSENLESSETPIQQASQTATEQPQNAPIVPSDSQQLKINTQSPIPNSLTLIDQLVRQAGQEIELVDAIAEVKNQLILNNLAVRDAELAEGINQHWQHQKQGYLGAIRDLASLAKEPVAITPDETDLTQEIEGIITELGKKLIA